MSIPRQSLVKRQYFPASVATRNYRGAYDFDAIEHFMPFFEQRISEEEFPSRVIRNVTQYGDVIASSLQFESDIVALEVLWLEVR